MHEVGGEGIEERGGRRQFRRKCQSSVSTGIKLKTQRHFLVSDFLSESLHPRLICFSTSHTFPFVFLLLNAGLFSGVFTLNTFMLSADFCNYLHISVFVIYCFIR